MLKVLLRWLQGAAGPSRSIKVPSDSNEAGRREGVSRARCSLCGRALENAEDPLSVDCGGDCWGCIGEIEADMGYEPSLLQVREESARGLRPGWTEAGNSRRKP
jgi:hypothetical protein